MDEAANTRRAQGAWEWPGRAVGVVGVAGLLAVVLAVGACVAPSQEAVPEALRGPATAPAPASTLASVGTARPPSPHAVQPWVAAPGASPTVGAGGVVGGGGPAPDDYALTPADGVRPGEGAASGEGPDMSRDTGEDADDEDVDLDGRVVEAPPEVMAAQAALAEAVVAADPLSSSPAPSSRDEQVEQAAVAAAATTSAPPSTTRPPSTPPPNPSPTLRPGVHPVAPDFPSWIEANSAYEPENVCDPVAKPGTADLQALLKVTYGAQIASNIVRACSSKNTGHKAGRALDWMVNSRNSAQAAMGDAFVAWLLAPDKYGSRYAMARRLGVMYVIWRGRSFGLYSGVWKEYDSCLTKATAKSDDNNCHRNHVHISMSWAGARRQTTWWTLAHGMPWCTAPSTPVWGHDAATGAPATLRQTRVFDSAGGTGTPVPPLPCRTAANSLLALPGLGVAGLPRSGVGQVQVRLSATGLGTASSLAVVGPPVVARRRGAPVTSLAVPAASAASAILWLPVNANGSIYLRVGAAPVNLTVDVLGYASVVAPVRVQAAATPSVRVLPRPTPARTVHR